MSKRKGFTIVEVLLAASIGTFLLALVTMLMIQTIDSHRSIRGHLQYTLTRRDLATIVRDDIHTAGLVTIEDNELSILKDDTSIIYSMAEDGIARIAKRGDAVVREDSFFISKIHAAEFSRNDQLGKTFLVFTVQKKLDRYAPVLTAIQIVAEIGKHNLP